MKNKGISVSEFRELTGKIYPENKKQPVTFHGPGKKKVIHPPVHTGEDLSRQEIRELTIKKKNSHQKAQLSTEEALRAMGTFFELDLKKVQYFIGQLQITGKIN